MNNIRNIEFYIKQYELKSGQIVYSPCIKYEKKGLFWGWNKMEHPICVVKDKVYDLDYLANNNDLGGSFYKYSTLEEARNFSEKYSQELNQFFEECKNNQIVNEKIIKL